MTPRPSTYLIQTRVQGSENGPKNRKGSGDPPVSMEVWLKCAENGQFSAHFSTFFLANPRLCAKWKRPFLAISAISDKLAGFTGFWPKVRFPWF